MSEDRLDRIERLVEVISQKVEANTQAIAILTQRVEAKEAENQAILERLEAEVRWWDKRCFQLSRDNLSVSRTIIIVAGSAVIFFPLLQSLSPVIQKLMTQFTQGSPAG